MVSRTNSTGPSWIRKRGEVSFLEDDPPCDASALHKSPLATNELSMSFVLLSYVELILMMPCSTCNAKCLASNKRIVDGVIKSKLF